MRIRRGFVFNLLFAVTLAGASETRAQSQTDESPWVFDLGFGIDVGLNGNVNSGVIGRLQGQTTAILPQPYGEVYGSGLQFRFGGGYTLSEVSELRGVFTYQSADAD